MLDESNSYVKTYRTIRDKFTDCQSGSIKLRILGKRNSDGRRYNLPTASEVTALIVGDFDAADCERDVIVEERSGLLKRISTIELSYFPFQYPLLFPRGEDGYRTDIEYEETHSKNTINMLFGTQLEWIAYRIQH